MSTALILLTLRVTLGLVVAAHGSQKLFGWFGGPGFAGETGWLASQGFKPAWFWTLLGGLGEFAGGLLLVLGLLNPLGALAIFGAMLMAVVKFHWRKGFWWTQLGYEYPLVLGILSVVLGLAGSGSYSLDALIGFSLSTPLVLVGLVLAALVVSVGIAISNRSSSKQATA